MKITFQLTLEDYIRARRLSMRPRKALRYIGCLTLISYLAFLVWQGYRTFMLSAPQNDFWMPFALAVYFLFLYFVMLPWRTKRIFKQQKTLHYPVELDLTETDFVGSSTHGTFKMAWGDFHKWKMNEHMILVYQSASLMHMVPLRAFRTHEDRLQLLAILRKHLGPEQP